MIFLEKVVFLQNTKNYLFCILQKTHCVLSCVLGNMPNARLQEAWSKIVFSPPEVDRKYPADHQKVPSRYITGLKRYIGGRMQVQTIYTYDVKHLFRLKWIQNKRSSTSSSCPTTLFLRSNSALTPLQLRSKSSPLVAHAPASRLHLNEENKKAYSRKENSGIFLDKKNEKTNRRPY